jgi:ankyrin repeat protein
LLRHAARTNQIRRATLLLAHGANPRPASGGDLHELAMARGNVEVAELLERHGAVPGPADERRAFVLACHRRDGAAARALLDEHPRLLELAADLLIDTAAARDLVELAELLLDLGVSPDAEKREGGYRALHHAATMDAANVARLLLERGAEVDARDGIHRATPLAWAVRPQALAATEVLGSSSRDIFSVATAGLDSRLRELLREPALAHATLDAAVGLGVLSGQPGETALFTLPEDEHQALAVVDVLLSAGADPAKRNRDGVTAAEKARARGLHAVAELLVRSS